MSASAEPRPTAGADLMSRLPFPESQRELDALRQRIEFDLFRAPATGVLLGRYRIERTLGRGGLGVVYLAHDPELERPVALKVARVRESSSLDELHAWVRREAQALARVDHPNVVEVYSVELVNQNLVLVMEYVEGRTLRACLRDHQLTKRELLAVFSGAARALHAAHEAGVIHRDFKPENVMIDGKGRARVLDFGLARIESPGPTKVSGAMGTLPYMAPEQLQGQPPRPATDQFAFCVALFEALSGRRPFPGRKVAARLEAIAAGPPPRPPEIEGALYRALTRGLALDPDDRFASMADLSRVLADVAKERRPELTAASVATVVVSTAMLAATVAARPEPTCAASTDDLRLAWNATAAEAGREHFARVWTPDPDVSWARVRAQLDAYAEDWARARDQACEATPVAIDAVNCLNAVLPLLERSATSVGTDDRTGLEARMVTISELPPPHTCLLAGPDGPRLDDVDRSTAELDLMADLAELRGIWLAGHEAEVVDRLRTRLEGPERGDARARALLLLSLANYSFERVPNNQTIAWAEEAYDLGSAEGRPVLATQAAALLGAAYAEEGDIDEANRWHRFAVASMLRGPTPMEARLDVLMSSEVLLERQAREVEAAAISLATYTMTVTDPDVTPLARARIASHAARVLARLDDLDGAEVLATQAFDLAVQQLGRGHPALAYFQIGLGQLACSRGRIGECTEHFRTAAVTPASGPTWITAAAQGELGRSLWEADKRREAIEAYRAAAATYSELSELHYGTAGLEIALHNLGSALRAVGKVDEAAQALRRAEALGRQRRGIAAAGTLIELSLLELDRDPRASRSFAEQAEVVYRANLAAENLRPWYYALALADLAHRHGDADHRDRLVAEVEAMPQSDALRAELAQYRAEWAQ